MSRPQPRSTRSYTIFPYTTLCRSAQVAFAALSKFDGRRVRRLTVAEMAQIAGRAGRHQRDGTFGSLGGEGSQAGFPDEEIDRIENHRFPRIDFLYWRDGAPPLDSVDELIEGRSEERRIGTACGSRLRTRWWP